MTLTLQDLPREIDEALRAKAQVEGKSLDQVAVEALSAGLKLSERPAKKRDLSDVAGTWIEDARANEVREFHERIDPEMGR